MEKDVPKWKAGMIDWVRYNICFCKTAVSLAAAILCYNVVNYNVVGLLTTYFTKAFNRSAVLNSAVLVNILGALQMLVVACKRTYPRRFGFRKTIAFSTSVYILGLLMLYLSASNRIPKTNFALYIPACVLIAVGKGGGLSILERDLLDQLIAGHENEEQIDWERARRRKSVLRVLSGVLILVIPIDGGWPTMFLISMCIIVISGFIYLVSSYFFHGGQKHPASCTKTHPETLPPDQPFKNEEIQLTKSSSNAGAEAKQKSATSPICAVKQVNVADRLLRMIPMWSTFIVFSLVMSTADTFFNLQVDSMEPNVTTTYFLLLQDVLEVVADSLCGWFLEKSRIWFSRSEQNFVLKLVICVGMILSVICPSLAWQVEVGRLKEAHEMGLLGKSEDQKVPMSDWRMAPLFFLWGLMEGISMQGLDEFFNYHVSKSMEDYGSEIYNTIPSAMGNFLSIVCVLACKGWFGDTLNQSRLDKYYRMITVLAWINLCWFFFVTTFYSTKEDEKEAGAELKKSKSKL